MVRLQKRPITSEQGNSFSHPLTLRFEEWAPILRSIYLQKQNQPFFFVTTKGSIEPAFTDEEIDYLSYTLPRAFVNADSDESVVFALSRQLGNDMLSVTTGEWFAKGSTLHLRLHYCRFTITMPHVRERIWESPLQGDTGPSYEFVPQRYQVTSVDNRSDGLIPSQEPSLTIAYRDLLQRAPSGQEERFPAISSESFEDQLRTLKRLKEEGLLTEDEFRKKKLEILQRF